MLRVTFLVFLVGLTFVRAQTPSQEDIRRLTEFSTTVVEKVEYYKNIPTNLQVGSRELFLFFSVKTFEPNIAKAVSVFESFLHQYDKLKRA